LFLIAEVAGLDEIHDAPQIQQPVFERCAGEGQAVFGLELLDRLRDLRARILMNCASSKIAARNANFCNSSNRAATARNSSQSNRAAESASANYAAPRRFRARAPSNLA